MAEEALDITAEQKKLDAEYAKQIAESEALTKREIETAKRQGEERKPLYEEMRRADDAFVRAATTNRPQYQQIPKPPSTQEMVAPTNLQKTFGMTAVFGLLAAGITRDRSMAGLSALGGF